MSKLTQDANKAISTRPEDNLILVDCNGTLFDGEFGNNNVELVEYLVAMKAVGFEVQIFSDRPESVQRRVDSLAMIMRNKGIDIDFGEVLRKDNFDGQKAFIVIDDDHSTHKVDCENLFSPTDARIAKTLRYSLGISKEFGKRTLN